MASKSKRTLLALKCSECKTNNYITEKNRLNTKEKLEFKKFCRRCRKVTVHKETDKLD